MLYQLTTVEYTERRKDGMERKENIVSNEIEINFEQAEFERFEEIEEVITPGAGTVFCCTN